MKSFLSIFAFLSLVLFADTIAAARKDGGDYWRAVMKHQPMPEALEELVRFEAASDEKTKCIDTTATIKEEKIVDINMDKANENKSTFAKDFEPKPNVSAYGDDANLKGKKTSTFAEDFEPRPNVSAYNNDINLKGKKASSFADNFEPRPNVSGYGDDANLKGEKSSSSGEDFEPRPIFWIYGGEDATVKEEKKPFTSEFEAEPTVTSYHN